MKPSLNTVILDNRKDRIEEFLCHSDALYSFAMKLTNATEDAKDLVQDTFLRATRFVNHYQAGTNARSWLFRMMYNLFINNYRKDQKSPFLNIENEHKNHFEYQVRPDAFQNTFSDEVMSAFNKLSPELKSALFLCDFEDLKYAEISKVLDVPVCTIKTRIHRARKSIRQSLLDSGFYSRNN